jgi:RimJ/RimL family protein N-acetyltransferase
MNIDIVYSHDSISKKMKYIKEFASIFEGNEDNMLSYLHDWHHDVIEGKKITITLFENCEAVGGVRVWQTPHLDIWLIEGLEVKEEHRRQGYGLVLVKACVKAMKELGEKDLYANISRSNIASIKTHERCGFKLVEEGTLNSLGDQRDHQNRYHYQIRKD